MNHNWADLVRKLPAQRERTHEPAMKKRNPYKSLRPKEGQIPQVVKTGEHCPVSGWWIPTSLTGSKHFVAEGSVMPADKGEPVSWTLVLIEPTPAAEGLHFGG